MNKKLIWLAIVLLMFLCGIALGIAIYIFYISTNRDGSAMFWNMITAFATLALALIAYKQLKGINDTSRADFAHKYNKNVFSDRTRELFTLFDYDLLELCNVEINGMDFCYFKKKLYEINPSPISAFFKPEEVQISSYEIDDYILGPFEEVSMLRRNGILSLSDIYESFEYYIVSLYENDQIQKYIESQRDRESTQDIYRGFEELYCELIQYGYVMRKESK